MWKCGCVSIRVHAGQAHRTSSPLGSRGGGMEGGSSDCRLDEVAADPEPSPSLWRAFGDAVQRDQAAACTGHTAERASSCKRWTSMFGPSACDGRSTLPILPEYRAALV